MTRHGLAFIEDDAIGESAFAADFLLVTALVMDGGCTLFAMCIACFVVGQFVPDGSLPRRDRLIALRSLSLVRWAIHRLLLRSYDGSAPALPLLRERNQDATSGSEDPSMPCAAFSF
jgi:hypothetical protein